MLHVTYASKAMQFFFTQHTDRMTVYQLPRYSPDFNPIEYLWRNIKKQTTHLRYLSTLDDLTQRVDEKLAYLAKPGNMNPQLAARIMAEPNPALAAYKYAASQMLDPDALKAQIRKEVEEELKQQRRTEAVETADSIPESQAGRTSAGPAAQAEVSNSLDDVFRNEGGY